MLLAPGVLSGCGDGLRSGSGGVSPTGVVVTGPAPRVEPDRPPPEDARTYIREQNVVRLYAAVNGVAAFQFVVTGSGASAGGLTLSAEEFAGTERVIPGSAVRFYRQYPITVSRYPNWYLRSQGLRRTRTIPDALVPIDLSTRAPISLLSGERLAIWAEIRIPPETRPETYRGGILMQDAGGVRRIPVEVNVRDVYLSPKDLLPVAARVQLGPLIAAHSTLDPRNLPAALADAGVREAVAAAFTLLHEHGLSPYTDELRPFLSLEQDGSVRLDWADFDAFCGPLIDGSPETGIRPAFVWPLPADLIQPDPAHYGGLSSTVYAAFLRAYLAKSLAHFAERGWDKNTFVYFDLPTALDPQAADYAHVRQLAGICHLVSPTLPFASRMIPQSMAPFGWFGHCYEDLSGEVDIWGTPARYQHPPTLQRLQALGRRTWLTPDRPPYSGSLAVEAPPIHSRSLPWQAFLQGHEAIWLEHTTAWPDQLLAGPIADRSTPTDTWLLYPGRPFGLRTPVPSIRLKQLQLGLQDHQLLQLLDDHGRGETARLIAGSLIKAAGTEAYGDNYQDGLFGRRVDDPQVWQLAANLLLDETASALLEEADLVMERPAVPAAWSEFLSATRRIELRPESARLKVDTRPGQTGFLLGYEVAIRNELRLPLQGVLNFAGLPEGVQRVSDIVRVGPIPEMGLYRGQLVASTATPPLTDLDGHAVQEITLDAGAAGQVSTTAVLSVVRATRVAAPPRIDGNLADWPPSEGNAAGDFGLLNSGEGASGAALAAGGRPRAESQTVVYFCRDDATLYIGLHAAAPAGRDGSPMPLRNFVEYEDLMPLDEDLVEILLDPTNLATQSEDLFHIVLKATGNPIFERGIGTTPPIGRRSPWPGPTPICCVSPTAYGWCAEVAIPLEVFGEAGGRNRVWGMNLARLEPSLGEYSDWARAPRYCYDPRTLGNLIWPE